jgi:superfamily II DNA or RNA helicase
MKIKDFIKEQRKKIDKTSTITLTEEQKKIIDKIEKPSFILICSTGVGKTILSLYLSQLFKSTLIIVPNIILYDQWLTRIEQFKIKNVFVEKIQTFKNKLKKLIDEEKPFPKYELLIIDEVHLNILTLKEILIYMKTFYSVLVGLTATPNEKEEEWYEKTFKQKIIFEKQKPFTVIKVNTEYAPLQRYKKMYIKSKNNSNKGVYKNAIDYNYMLKTLSENENRTKDIVFFVINIITHFPLLILCKRIKMIDALGKFFQENKITYEKVYKNKKLDLTLDVDVYIGNYQKLGVGVDTNIFKTLIILDNIEDVRQAEGRLRNENFILYDFVDNHSIFEKHWEIRRDWYLKRHAFYSKYNDLTLPHV